MASSPFSGVPRPEGSSNLASGVSAQMSSWMSSVKEAGNSALGKINENQHMAAFTTGAAKLGENVAGAVRSNPIANAGQKGAEQMQTLMTGQQKEPESVTEYIDEATSMSYKNRLIGFGVCLASGVFFSALSTLMLPLIVLKPHKFAVAYSIGNLLMMGSTVFLIGPKQQCQTMWKGHRAMASGAYFISMVGTIYAAMGLRIYILVVFFIGVQFASLCWYSLSYIPFGRQLASRFLKPVAKIVGSCLYKTCGFCASRCAPNLLPR